MSRLDRLRPHTEITVLKAPSAPGLWLAFGTWQGGVEWPRPIIPYSAGKGVTRAHAERACLGEMAEHLSIGVWAHDPAKLKVIHISGEPFEVDPRQVLVHDLNDRDDPGSEGVAAGETLDDAIEAAFCERLERIARRRWWAGDEVARPIAEDWLRDSGLRAYEASLRGAMLNLWRASFYLIGLDMPLNTVVAITKGPKGRSLGTATAEDPADASRRALNEAILEEVPLLTGNGKDEENLSREEKAGRARSTNLLTQTSALSVEGASPEHESCFVGALGWHEFECVDLTHSTVSVPVVRAILRGAL